MNQMTLEQKIDLLFDEREICRLINRFDISTNEGDLEAFSEIWTDDAVWEISKQIYSKAHGKKDVIKMLEKLLQPLDFFFRTTQMPTIEFHANGHSATSRSETIELARMEDGKSYSNVAFYSDELRKVDGKWLFSARHYEYIWVQTELILVGQAITRRKE